MSYTLEKLYGKNGRIYSNQKKRYTNLKKKFETIFKSKPPRFFSTPGRTELSGNHTDHNHGKVIAASVNLDSIAAVSPNTRNEIVLYSEGYKKPFIVGLDNLEPRVNEKSTTAALIRGIAAGLTNRGYSIGGFDAVITSDVLQGSGLSSSASIEVLIGTIFNCLFNKGKITPVEISIIGQFAEDQYFGKPCGLMDQIACAVGGILSIDFKNPYNPTIQKIKFDSSKQNYALLFIHSGGSHINLTEDYAAIPNEMKSVAAEFGKQFCREIYYNDFLKKISKLRRNNCDRSVLRAFHFFKENERVSAQITALKKNNFNKFLNFVKLSGDSSFKYLQNIYSTSDVCCQPLSLALALTEDFIFKLGEGACRVHGGGFEGTIQVFIPNNAVKKFEKYMSYFSDDFNILKLDIRNIGTTEVILNS